MELSSRRQQVGSKTNLYNLNLYYTNADSLYNKLDELKIMLQAENIHIICITETCFNSELLDGEIAIPRFNTYRKDKINSSTGKGGGTVMYMTPLELRLLMPFKILTLQQ